MRKIPAVLAVLGLTAVGLTGCAIPAGFDDCTRATASDPSVTDLVTVDGAFGSAPTITSPTPFHVDETAYADLETGQGDHADGAPLTSPSQLVALDISIVSGSTGETLVSSPFDGDLTRVNTFERWIEAVPALETALHCATPGTRTVIALAPGDIKAETAASLGMNEDDSAIAVVDLEKTYLTRAQGSLVYNDARGMPTVVRAPDGRPGIIVPDGDAPTDLVVQTLIQGDGPEVTGDQPIRVAYTGVTWKGKEVFDSTWDSEPASVTLDGVVDGFAQALEGATVGSQLLVVIPPELAYGDKAQGEIPAGSTLVFVIDILGLDEPAQE